VKRFKQLRVIEIKFTSKPYTDGDTLLSVVKHFSIKHILSSFFKQLMINETYYVENIKSTNFISGTNTKSTNL